LHWTAILKNLKNKVLGNKKLQNNFKPNIFIFLLIFVFPYGKILLDGKLCLLFIDKGKPSERVGRKAMGLSLSVSGSRLPKEKFFVSINSYLLCIL
jgi:hypothetical protein